MHLGDLQLGHRAHLGARALVGRELHVLPRLRGDGLDLLETEPEQVGLAGPLAGRGDHVGELGLGGDEAGVQVGVAAQQRGGLVAAEAATRPDSSGRKSRFNA